jgi:hypothetical protein
MRGRLLVLVLTLPLVGVGCGGSGINPPPIQMLVYVSGGTGLQFTLPDTPDAAACGSGGTGIQAPNADHEFPNRIFETPYLFILNKIRQPVQLVIQSAASNAAPIRVDTFLGVNPQNSGVFIAPGDCQTIITSTALPLGTPSPGAGPQFEVDACAPLDPTTDEQNLNLDCVQPTPAAPDMPVPTPLGDRQVAYFSSVGDIKITYISNCILTSLLDACRSPSTIFFEQPQSLLAAIISVNSGQNTDPSKPPAGIRLELYQDGQRIEVSNSPSTNPKVTTQF